MIDVLVMQALEHKFTNEHSQEIETFTHVLYDMHSSLKSWTTRFEQIVGSSKEGLGNQLERTLSNKDLSAVDVGKNAISCGAHEPDLDLIVSPSPLVSWRNGACTVESGRQLFLLTPLQKPKSIASKFSKSSKCLQGGLNKKNGSCHTRGLVTSSNAPTCDYGNAMEKVNVKPMANKFLVPGNGASVSTSNTNFVSSASNANCIHGGLNNKSGSRSTHGLVTSSNAPSSNYGNIVKEVDIKSAPYKFLVPGNGALDNPSNTNFVSLTSISSCKDSVVYAMSPYVKNSPFKTCFLLESVSDSIQQDEKIIRKGTPWIVRTQRKNSSPLFDTLASSEYSQNCGSDEISTTLASKYPELFGLPPAKNSTIQRKEVDETLDWFLSPPKTCVLMEPVDEKLVLSVGDKHLLNSEQEISKLAGPDATPMWKDLGSTTENGRNAGEVTVDEKVVLPSGRGKHQLNSEQNNSKLAAPEATPMWRDLEITTENGKNAGEATLKRELWTKFEAVSTNGLQVDSSFFQQRSRNRFLDMLEEVL